MFQKSSQENVEDKLLGFIKNAGYRIPTLLQKTVLPLTLQERDIVVEAGPGEGRTGLFLISLLVQKETCGNGTTTLILTASANEVHKVIRQFRRFSARLRGRPRFVGVGTTDNFERELRVLSESPDVLAGTSERIIDHLRRQNVTLENVRKVILVIPENPERTGFFKDVLYIYSKLTGKYQTQIYCPGLSTASPLDSVLKRPLQVPKTEWSQINEETGKKERGSMTEKKTGRTVGSTAGNSAKAEAHIRSLLKLVKENANPDELNEYRRIFRKNTPIHLRAYLAAYLLMTSTDTGPSVGSEFKSLFVSIGKNKRVYPNDLKQLFVTQLGISEGEIGNIKVLDNYSFVDVAAPYAQKAIETLNATAFRGRKLTVNYSRKKN